MTNLKQATKPVQKASSNGEQVIILHEHFNSPYDTYQLVHYLLLTYNRRVYRMSVEQINKDISHIDGM